MKSITGFIVSPDGERYNNKVKVGDKELIVNSEIQNHEYVNRLAVVKSTPIINNTDIEVGDTVVVHHNVFRRWHNVKKKEKNTRSFLKEDEYIIQQDQIFLYKKNDSWKCIEGFCFIQPIKSLFGFDVHLEEPCVGIVKYTDGSFDEDQLVGFHPSSMYEFIIEGCRLYRVYSKYITIKYERKGNEEAYNPSWAQSS